MPGVRQSAAMCSAAAGIDDGAFPRLQVRRPGGDPGGIHRSAVIQVAGHHADQPQQRRSGCHRVADRGRGGRSGLQVPLGLIQEIAEDGRGHRLAGASSSAMWRACLDRVFARLTVTRILGLRGGGLQRASQHRRERGELVRHLVDIAPGIHLPNRAGRGRLASTAQTRRHPDPAPQPLAANMKAANNSGLRSAHSSAAARTTSKASHAAARAPARSPAASKRLCIVPIAVISTAS